jgi:hypothetical protein
MTNSKIPALFVASVAADEWQDVGTLAAPLAESVSRLVLAFLANPISPQAACDFEKNLRETVRAQLRDILEWTYNQIESEDPQAVPKRLQINNQEYRRRDKSPNDCVATSFGVIRLNRYLYEPLEPGEACVFPLEMTLGLAARHATPALAERVAELAVSCTQQEVLHILRRDFDVGWSVETLRKVTAAVSQGMSVYLHEAQVEQVLAWLRKADKSRGRHTIALSVGRDGIFLPIRGEKTYKEGAVATMSVYDRRGRRLGTIYLGQMPEPYQKTLSERLTRLIESVLRKWNGSWPRLAYVTDAGDHPTDYYQDVLCRMKDPRSPEKLLHWIWIVDFYHASSYVHKMAAVLFKKERDRQAWAGKMCKWLKHKPHGVFRVLHSAAKYHAEGDPSWKEEEEYQKAYQYLKKHQPWMDYAAYQRQGLPIGSGVTEAACKTVFSQRFKESGMSWNNESGQFILDLRVTRLSGVWTQVHQRYLRSLPVISYATKSAFPEMAMQIPA